MDLPFFKKKKQEIKEEIAQLNKTDEDIGEFKDAEPERFVRWQGVIKKTEELLADLEDLNKSDAVNKIRRAVRDGNKKLRVAGVDELEWLDEIISGDDFATACKEMGFTQAMIEKQARENPGLLLYNIWDKSRDAVNYDISSMYNLLSPTKQELRKYNKLYMEKNDEIKNSLHQHFEDLAGLSNNPPDEVKTVLDDEDKLVNLSDTVFDMSAKERYAKYLWAVGLRGYSQWFIDRRKELVEIEDKKEKGLEECDKIDEKKAEKQKDLEEMTNRAAQAERDYKHQMDLIKALGKQASPIIPDETPATAQKKGGKDDDVASEKNGAGNDENSDEEPDDAADEEPDDEIVMKGDKYRLLLIKGRKVYVKEKRMSNGAHVAMKPDKSSAGAASDKDYKRAVLAYEREHDEEDEDEEEEEEIDE